MSIYSDYACGALTDEEFRSLGNYENRRERWYEEHRFDDYDEEEDEEEQEDEEDE